MDIDTHSPYVATDLIKIQAQVERLINRVESGPLRSAICDINVSVLAALAEYRRAS